MSWLVTSSTSIVGPDNRSSAGGALYAKPPRVNVAITVDIKNFIDISFLLVIGYNGSLRLIMPSFKKER
jgi:hypothetical protein